MPTLLYDAVKQYISKDTVRTHTPGHSGKSPVLAELESALLKFDVTEVSGLDSLYHADGAIMRAEQLATRFFGTKATLFSAGGCTLAIQTMLALTLKPGDILLASRNAHVSVQNCCALLGVDLRFVYPESDMRVSPSAVEDALKANANIKAVMITSPNYYGIMSDIAAISAVCRAYDVPLLVDNAHGTHLKLFGLHPIQLGADITSCSAHKTLPALTGGAFLNIANEKYVANAKQKMSLFGSTSPSYPIMVSLDLCREYCENSGKADFERLKFTVSHLREVANKFAINTLSEHCDPVRLTLDMGTKGEITAANLRQNGVECEMCDERFVVMILTPFHTETDVEKIENTLKKCPPSDTPNAEKQLEIPQFAVPLRQAMFAEKETIGIDAAVGRIAASSVTMCPPGIPVVVPGEIISSKIAAYLKNSGTFSANVIK